MGPNISHYYISITFPQLSLPQSKLVHHQASVVVHLVTPLLCASVPVIIMAGRAFVIAKKVSSLDNHNNFTLYEMVKTMHDLLSHLY